MRTALLTILAALSLMADGQIDDTLLAELDMLAYEQESVSGIRPEALYYEAEGMGLETQLGEASDQGQNESVQNEGDHQGGGDYLFQ